MADPGPSLPQPGGAAAPAQPPGVPAARAGLSGAAMPRGLVVILCITGLLITTLALQQFSTILAPVLLALVLVIGVHPLAGILHRHGAPQWLAVVVTLLAVFAIIIGLAVSFAVSIARLGTLLPTYQDEFTVLVANLRTWLATLGVGPEQLQAVAGQISFGRVAGVITDILLGLAGTFTDLVFLLFVVLFMGLDSVYFARRLARVGEQHSAFLTALGGFVTGTRSYLVVSTVFGFVVAVIDGVFLWIAGVPLAVLWGLLAFVTNYIPNVGFLIGLAPPALLALLESGPQLMLIVIVVYCAINFVIQSVIQPKFVSDAVDISLTLTFLSLVFWTFVIGPLGAVLAIPLTLLAKALLLDVDPSTRWISGLFASGPAPPDTPPDTPPETRAAGAGPARPDRSPTADDASPT
ncbi:MAG: AI-2E family transporter [Pseudonocardia sp.]|nr:AI-2E family transporter [Pseudonocardia sp.]